MPRLVPRERKPSAKLQAAEVDNKVTYFKKAAKKKQLSITLPDEELDVTPARKKQKKDKPTGLSLRFEPSSDRERGAVVYDLELLKQKKHQRAAKEHARVPLCDVPDEVLVAECARRNLRVHGTKSPPLTAKAV